MKKITTLFKKNPDNLALVTEELDPENAWVRNDAGVKATRKFDGTACAVIDGVLYKRYDVKNGRAVPAGAIPCQEPDAITGHWPHWVKVNPEAPEDQYHVEAFQNHEGFIEDGTYELCGPRVQGNPEKFAFHTLVRHGSVGAPGMLFWGFENIKMYLSITNIEGIVFHHPDGRMCKIRKSDFGFKR